MHDKGDSAADVQDAEAFRLQYALGLHTGYGPEVVAQALSVNVSTVYRWLQYGQLHGTQIGKLWRVTAEDLGEFIRRQDENRDKIRRAKNELRRMLKLRPSQHWRIETCAMCGSPIVTDGSVDSMGRSVSRYSSGARKKFFACWL